MLPGQLRRWRQAPGPHNPNPTHEGMPGFWEVLSVKTEVSFGRPHSPCRYHRAFVLEL